MAAMINEDAQTIVVGNGDDRVAVNLKQVPNVSESFWVVLKSKDIIQEQSQSLLLTSILIDMGDLEIQIRRSTKSAESYKRRDNAKSPSITYQYGNQEQKKILDEKPVINPPYWDYSASHGKIIEI